MSNIFFHDIYICVFNPNNLRGVHPTEETISTVYIIQYCRDHLLGVLCTVHSVCSTPRRQTAHLGVKIEIFTYLWLLFKKQSR